MEIKMKHRPLMFVYLHAVVIVLLIMSIGKKAHAQTTTETVSFHVSGNCGMCKENIESAAKGKGVVKVDWNKDTKIITVEYNPAKADLDKMKKRIANMGYDNDGYKAKDEDYNALHGCCQYERKQ
jgi:mercuric ion binding protein